MDSRRKRYDSKRCCKDKEKSIDDKNILHQIKIRQNKKSSKFIDKAVRVLGIYLKTSKVSEYAISEKMLLKRRNYIINEKSLECNFCNKKFKTNDIFKKHQNDCNLLKIKLEEEVTNFFNEFKNN